MDTASLAKPKAHHLRVIALKSHPTVIYWRKWLFRFRFVYLLRDVIVSLPCLVRCVL